MEALGLGASLVDGGASAPTERVVAQSGAATETVAHNEVLQVTTDNAALTIDIEAPGAGEVSEGRLVIVDGGSGNNLTFTGATASSWPGGSMPDMSAGRWVIGCSRRASGAREFMPTKYSA